MKKCLFALMMLLSSVFMMRVDAISSGPSTDDKGEVFLVSDMPNVIGVPAGGSNYLVLSYGGVFEEEDVNLGKIEVSINLPSELSSNLDSSEVSSPDTVSGSGTNYTVTVNSTGDEIDGKVLTKINFPSKSTFAEYKTIMTVKTYDKSNKFLKVFSKEVYYYAFPKLNNCDSNYDVTVTTNQGTPTKTDALIYDLYTMKATSDKLEITITPASSKSSVSSTNENFVDPTKLNNNKTGQLNVKYGENNYYFKVDTECSNLANTFSEKLRKVDVMVGIDTDDITDYPGYLVVSVTREDNRSKVNTLSSLKISDVEIAFKPELKTYIASVPYTVKSVKIESTLTDAKSSYVKDFGNRTVELKEGENTVEVKVKSESDSEAVYTIKITREKNADASLKTLTVNKDTVELKPEVLAYTVYVKNEVETALIEAVPTDDKATVEVDKIEKLLEGENKANITVTASNGMKKIYMLTIIRDKLISENSRLKGLVVKGYELAFSPDKLEYSLKIPKDVKSLDFKIQTDHEAAKYIISGNKDLENESIIKIKVTAEDEKTTTTYLIKIEKEKSKLNILFIILPAVSIVVIVLIIVLLTSKKKKNKEVAPVEESVTPSGSENNE